MDIAATIIGSAGAGALLMALAVFARDWRSRRRVALLTPEQHHELAEQFIADQGLGRDPEQDINADVPRDSYGRAGLRPGLWPGEKAVTQMPGGNEAVVSGARRTLIPELYCEQCNEPRGGSVCPLCASPTIDIPPEVLAEEIEAHRPKGSES